jgi:hypothetical protein
MVGAAKGNRELIADPAAQCARLRKPQMMGVGWLASAYEAWLRGHETPGAHDRDNGAVRSARERLYRCAKQRHC